MKRTLLLFGLTSGLLALLGFAVAGCSDSTMAERVQACLDQTVRENRMAWWAQGTWRVQGVGKRSGCTDPRLNTDDFRLGSESFRMRQDGYDLSLDSSAASVPRTQFVSSGSVGASCLRFVTTETLGSSEIRYDFAGQFVGTSAVSGEFSGFGPDTCRTEGKFDLIMTLDPLPPRAGDDAGVTDGVAHSDGADGGDVAVDAVAMDAVQEDGGLADADAGEVDTGELADAPSAVVDANDGSVSDAEVGPAGGAANGNVAGYELWSGSVHAEVKATGRASCAMTPGLTVNWLGAGSAVVLVLGLARRRRRLARDLVAGP